MASSPKKLASNSGEVDGSAGNARPQDVEWLSSLSEPELDFLISLKEMATKRAKNAGCKDLGDKFDLKMLRALAAVLFEYLKERICNTPMFPNADEILAALSGCSLAVQDQETFVPLVHEDIKELTSANSRRKRMWEGLCEEQTCQSKRQKTKETDV